MDFPWGDVIKVGGAAAAAWLAMERRVTSLEGVVKAAVVRAAEDRKKTDTVAADVTALTLAVGIVRAELGGLTGRVTEFEHKFEEERERARDRHDQTIGGIGRLLERLDDRRLPRGGA